MFCFLSRSFPPLLILPFNCIRNEAEDKRSIKPLQDMASGFNFYENQHVFQEYTYKKITPCDVCGEILRGW